MALSSETTPESLLMAAQAGAEGSLGRLLQLYSNYLHLLAMGRLDDRVRARVSASDVVQETMFEAHRDFHQFAGRSPGEFLGWLRKILVNNLARLVERHVLAEKRDVRREVSLDEIGVAVDRSAACLAALLQEDVVSPSSHAQTQEQIVLMADSLAELPPDYREVILLRHLEGMPFNEIGAKLGRSSGAVRMLWLRAIEQLRARFSERGWL